MTPAPAPSAVLFLDCTQRESVLALEMPARDGVRLVRRFAAEAGAPEGERFWLELVDLFAEAGAGAEALAAVAVATGPGGFTGLRVSIACAKAIAYAREIPAVGVSSAELFAASDAARGGAGPWLVALASKAGSAWVSAIAPTADGPAPGDGVVVSEEAFARMAAETARGGGALLADAHLDPALRARADGAGVAVRGLAIDADAAFACARRALVRVVPSGAAGGAGARPDSESFGSPFALEPLYAREPEAVTNWRLRRAGHGS